MKKLITILFLLFSLYTYQIVFAADGTCGTNVSYSVNGDIISFSGAGPDAEWSNNCKTAVNKYPDVKTLNIENTIKIGRGTFSNLSNIEKMNVSNIDISDQTSLKGMFKGCESLKELDISSWSFSHVTDISEMFSDCNSLEELDVSDWDVSRVTDMSNIFEFCHTLSNLDVANWDTSNVQNMSSMFVGTWSLQTLDVRNWNTSNVTDMGSMFSWSALTNLDLKSWDTSKVTNMCGMFSWTNLSNLEISSWDTSNVTDMRGMFSGCSELTSLDISNWNTSNVTNMEEMFGGDLNIPGCQSLTELDLSKWDVSKVTNMSRMFSDCTSLKELDLSEWDVSAVTDMINMFKDCSSLTKMDLSNWDVSAVTDMRWMFGGCGSLTDLNLNSWNASNVIYMNSMFSDCTELINLNVKDWDISSARDLRFMFSNCSSLKNLDLSGWKTTNLSDMSDMFYYCTSLENLDINDLQTKNVTAMHGVFDACENLKNIDLSNWDTSNVKDMNMMFANCQSLEKINISGWDTSKVQSPDYVFGGNWNLKTVVLGKNSLNTNIFTFYHSNDDWYYIKYGEDTVNPLPLGNSIKGEVLFGSYDYETMAGIWSTDSSYEDDNPDPYDPPVTGDEIRMELFKFTKEGNFKGTITALEYNDGNIIPGELESSDEFILQITLKNGMNRSIRETISLPNGLSFSKENYERISTVTLDGKNSLLIPVYSVYDVSNSNVNSVSISISGELAGKLDIKITSGAGKVFTNPRPSMSDHKGNYEEDIKNGLIPNWGVIINENFTKNEAILALEVEMAPELCKQNLHNLGFTNIEHYPSTGFTGKTTDPTSSEHFIGQKKITVGNEIKTLVIIVIRGSNGLGEWLGNITAASKIIGPKTFTLAANTVYMNLMNYMNNYQILPQNSISFVIGHSRGAAAADILGHRINQDRNWYKSVAYGFAAPNTAPIVYLKKDRNIYNYDFGHDLVSYIPQDYKKYGSTATVGISGIPSAVSRTFSDYTGKPYNPPDASNMIDLVVRFYESKDLQDNLDSSFWIMLVKELFASPNKTLEYNHSFENYISWLKGNWTNNAVEYENRINMTSPQDNIYLDTISRCTENSASCLKMAAKTIKSTFQNVAELGKSISNFISIACPVDVKLYDSNGNIVVSIVDHQMEFVMESDEFFAYTDGESDYIFYPVNSGYYLEIIGNDDGTLEIETLGIDNTLAAVDQVSFTNVQVRENEHFRLITVDDNLEDSSLVSDGVSAPDTNTRVIITDKDDLSKTIDLGTTGERWEKLTYQLGAIVRPNEKDQQITWTSSDPSIATVDDLGLVTGRNNGTVIITAAAADGSNASASVELIVETNVQPGNLLVSNVVPVGIGLQVQLNGEINQAKTPSVQNFLWSSEDPKVALINDDGQITGAAEGTALIKICPAETGKYCAYAEIEVLEATEELYILSKEAIDITGKTIRLTDTNTMKLKAHSEPDTASYVYKWSSSDSNIAAVDETGLVTFFANGTVTITVETTDGSGLTASVTLNHDGQVAPKPVSIVINPSDTLTLQIGQTVQLSSAVFPDASDQRMLWFSSAEDDSVIVDINGLLTANSAASNIIITAVSAVDPTVSSQIIVNVTDRPNPPEPPDDPSPDDPSHNGRDFWRFDIEDQTLPHTGFSARSSQILPEMPKSIDYKPLLWTLQLPSLSISADIVEVPFVNGEYTVTWLGNSVGLLEGFANPGEGRVVLTGHNHLNTTETGPFAYLSSMEKGDKVFLLNANNEMQNYEVYANEKVSENDYASVAQIAEMFDNTITMLTCEDEMVGGGYANRRVVAAKPVF